MHKTTTNYDDDDKRTNERASKQPGVMRMHVCTYKRVSERLNERTMVCLAFLFVWFFCCCFSKETIKHKRIQLEFSKLFGALFGA